MEMSHSLEFYLARIVAALESIAESLKIEEEERRDAKISGFSAERKGDR